jgi:DHA2 family multidrug resistance protein
VSAVIGGNVPASALASEIKQDLKTEVAPDITVAKLFVMGAALISLYVDQSFGGSYTTIQSYAGGSLGMSVDELSWATIGYNACYWPILLLTPWLIGKLGRRSIFTAGHALFAIVSLFLALTASMHGFIIGRCIQGFAQGTFFVCSVATVLTLFPPKYRGIAFAIFSVTSLSGAASGAFVGGWFIDHEYWRGVFVLYGALTLVAGIVVATLLEAPGPQKNVTSDWTGVSVFFVACFAFNYVTAYGERRDWLADGWIVFYIGLFVVAITAFVLRELKLGEKAFIRLNLFGTGNLAVGSALGFGLGAPLFGANEFLIYAQTQLGLPPSTAGALLTLRILAILFVAPTAVLLVNAGKIDVKIPVALGFVFVPASYALLSMQTTYASNFWTFAFALVLSGAGFACLFSPIANVTVRSLPPPLSPQGIAIFKLMLLLGGSIGSTALTVLYDHSYDEFLSLLAGHATMRHLTQIGLPAIPPAAYSGLVKAQAAVLAYADNSKWVAFSALFNIPLIFLLKPPPKNA